MQPVSVSDKGDGTVQAISQNYTYDNKGRVKERKGSLGTSSTYDYDGKDRVTAMHYKNAFGAEELRTTYTYDKSDNITSMTDYNVAGTTATPYRYTEYKYDKLKRVTSVTEMNTKKEPSALTAEEKEKATTKYNYDIDGNLLAVTYPKPDWKVTGQRYEYDKNKWLKTIKVVTEDGKEAVLRTYDYDEYGSVSDITDYRVMSKTGEIVKSPESTTCHYTYDTCRRPVSMTYTDSENPDVTKEAYTYQYDKNSRLVKETLQNLYPEKEDDRQDEVRSYEYDRRGNLVQTKVENRLNAANSYTSIYTYDAVGNRTGQKQIGGAGTLTTDYRYNSLNQLTGSDTKDTNGTSKSSKVYTYDADGNQIKETDTVKKQEKQNIYDPAGRLKECTITENGNQKVKQTNLYNGAGSRIRKSENGKTTDYYYSNGGVLYTTDENGKETSLNLQGISGNVIATGRKKDTQESYYYYHKDPAGSITNLRDADGKSIVSYQYTDFGETSIHGDKDFYNELCYNESIYDESTGLYYLSARYYDPEDGRFISRDSYRGNSINPSTWNLYAYCANSPVNYEDPSGHIAISRIIGGIIGGGIGFLAGRKIAKKTKAKGWKKYAIIAGCTIGGAAIGALAGPRVAKVAKKAARLIKRKIPSRQRVWNVTKKVARKAVTKTRNAISKGKSRTISKRIGKIAWESAKGGSKSGLQTAALNSKKGEKKSDIMKSIAIGAIVGGISAGSDMTAEHIGKAVEGGTKVARKILTSGLFNFSISVINKQTRFQTLKTTGLGAMQGAMSLGVDTLKVLAGTSEFQVGSYIIGSADYFNDFAFGLLDAGTM